MEVLKEWIRSINLNNFPLGLILAVVIGTVAGMLIGCFLLVIVFFFKQRSPHFQQLHSIALFQSLMI